MIKLFNLIKETSLSDKLYTEDEINAIKDSMAKLSVAIEAFNNAVPIIKHSESKQFVSDYSDKLTTIYNELAPLVSNIIPKSYLP
jgi:hypothetical protein